MKNFIKLTSALLAAALSFSIAACKSDKNTESGTKTASNEISSLDSTDEAKKEPYELKNELVGQWGRLEEVMHYFTADGRCFIGGIQGSYEIDGECNLILTTMEGSVTIYDWASSRGNTTTENYWYLEDDSLIVNGNKFEKISDKETPDFAE